MEKQPDSKDSAIVWDRVLHDLHAAETYCQNGDYEQANLIYYDLALHEGYRNSEFAAFLAHRQAVCLAQSGDIVQAAKHFDKALSTNYERPVAAAEILFDRAKMYLASGFSSKASDDLTSARQLLIDNSTSEFKEALIDHIDQLLRDFSLDSQNDNDDKPKPWPTISDLDELDHTEIHSGQPGDEWSDIQS